MFMAVEKQNWPCGEWKNWPKPVSTTDVVPDVIAWNSVIGAIAHSDDPTPAQRAQAMLDRMQNLYPVKGNGRLSRPVGIAYS